MKKKNNNAVMNIPRKEDVRKKESCIGGNYFSALLKVFKCD